MKNHFLVTLILTSVFLSNCKSNDDNAVTEIPAEKKYLLSKTTTIYYDNPNNPETSVGNLSYNTNGQLAESESAGRISAFEYDTSGKPVKVSYYKADKTLEYYDTYTYNGDLLTNIKAVYTNPAFNRNISYTYDGSGKLSGSKLCQSADCTNPYISTYTYNGDNISAESTVSDAVASYSYKREFSYDDKLNPYTNTNKYLKIMMGGSYTMSKNNYTSEKLSYRNSDGNWVQNGNITYAIQYNDANLPVMVIGKDASGNNYVQYNYEYITK